MLQQCGMSLTKLYTVGLSAIITLAARFTACHFLCLCYVP